MIAIERRISPSVCDCSGEGFSVQFTYRACRSEKSQVLVLLWRRTHDPYAILVSEVMLQQTQVERVVPRYRDWLERWPTVEALAAASPADVIREWQGPGYNRPGLNLHRAAQHIGAPGWPDGLPGL